MVNDARQVTDGLLSGSALAIGAHPDDVEFGCFGSLQRFAQRHVLVLTTGESGGPAQLRSEEASQAASVIKATVKILDMPDTALNVADAIPAIREAVELIQPDVVFTTSTHEGHQDHANLGSAVRSALRHFEGMILAYVTPSATEAFAPTAFFRLTGEEFDLKLRAIEAHKTQLDRPYLSQRAIEAYGRYWATRSGTEAEWCEPFEVVRLFRT
jgi:LmbE family N-acetylglucosaminyl deacetylase